MRLKCRKIVIDIAEDSDNMYEEGNIIGVEEDSSAIQENHDELINANHNVSETYERNEGNNGENEINTTTHRYNLRPNRSLNYSVIEKRDGRIKAWAGLMGVVNRGIQKKRLTLPP